MIRSSKNHPPEPKISNDEGDFDLSSYLDSTTRANRVIKCWRPICQNLLPPDREWEYDNCTPECYKAHAIEIFQKWLMSKRNMYVERCSRAACSNLSIVGPDWEQNYR